MLIPFAFDQNLICIYQNVKNIENRPKSQLWLPKTVFWTPCIHIIEEVCILHAIDLEISASMEYIIIDKYEVNYLDLLKKILIHKMLSQYINLITLHFMM